MSRCVPLLRCMAVASLTLCLGCSRLVNAVLYAPDRALWGTPASIGLKYEDLRFSTADGAELHGWWIPGERPGPALLFFHGNAGDMADRLDLARLLHDHLGLGVLLFDYRGYGESSGQPSEAGLGSDASAVRALARKKGWDGDGGVILYGRSLGASVALRSAVEDPPLGLVLEGAFTSLDDVARLHHPILSQLFEPWIRGRYDNLSLISALTRPVLFFHGDRDRVCPVEMGWRLYDACPAPKRFRSVVGGGHQDLAQVGGETYWEAWQEFLDECESRERPAGESTPKG